jgi:hypothetical protein
VAVTVVWMLTILSSLAAELAMLACLALSRWAASEGPNLARTAAGALLLAALVTGVLCLVLTPVVWRIRRIKPPLAIVAAAVLVGLAPLATLIILSWLTQPGVSDPNPKPEIRMTNQVPSPNGQ